MGVRDRCVSRSETICYDEFVWRTTEGMYSYQKLWFPMKRYYSKCYGSKFEKEKTGSCIRYFQICIILHMVACSNCVNLLHKFTFYIQKWFLVLFFIDSELSSILVNIGSYVSYAWQPSSFCWMWHSCLFNRHNIWKTWPSLILVGCLQMLLRWVDVKMQA
jgi:hypothetical protein